MKLGLIQLTREFFRRSAVSKKIVSVHIVITIFSGLIQAVMPYVAGWLVDQMISDSGAAMREHAWEISLIVIAAAVLYYIVEVLNHSLLGYFGAYAKAGFQEGLYHHLQHLSEDFYHRTKVGEVSNRMTEDMNNGVEPFYFLLSHILWAVCMVLLCCSVMATIHIELCFLIMGLSAFWGVFGKFTIPKIRKLRKASQDEYGKLNAQVTENISANSVIRIFAREKAVEQEVSNLADSFYNKAMATQRHVAKIFCTHLTFFNVLAPLAMLMAGAYYTSLGQLSIGQMVAVYGYWRVLAEPFGSLIGMLSHIFGCFASLDRIMEFFAETPLVKDNADAKDLVVSDGGIELKDLNFFYPLRKEEKVLDQLNLKIKPHEKVGIVGKSGSGKSTLVRMMLRLYDPSSGDVFIDGQNLKNLRQLSVRSNIGMVMQDTMLLNGTVRENLQFTNPDATDEQITLALKNAEAWDFVTDLPLGLDTVLGERGQRLSGGQKQRISIARVFLKNPPIVIFDEATSALDTITEQAVQETMDSLFEGRTCIIIAHRLSTLMNCDRIALMQEGKLEGLAPHKELYSQNDDYRKMCKEQEL